MRSLIVLAALAALAVTVVYAQTFPDTDMDGFVDNMENYQMSDVNDGCPNVIGEHFAFPADNDIDRFVDTADLARLTNWFGQSVPPAPRYADIFGVGGDGFSDTADIARMTGLFGWSCTN